MSGADHPSRARSERRIDRHEFNDASAPAEHVRTLCPRLIATLLAIAQASTDGAGGDDAPAAASASSGRCPIDGSGPAVGAACPPITGSDEPPRDPRTDGHRQVRGYTITLAVCGTPIQLASNAALPAAP